jgi:O-antigen ligase
MREYQMKPGWIGSLFSIPNLAAVFAVIVSPLALFFTETASKVPGMMETRYENKIFWPLVTLATAILAIRHFRSRGKIVWSPQIVCLFLYLGFAGLSVLWAFAPNLSLIRFVQQVMIVACVIFPPLLIPRSMDLMRGLYLCFAIAVALNLFFVIGGYQTFADNVAIGYSGYFLGKNYLGECAAIALLLAIYELSFPGTRRFLGVMTIVISIILLVYANSKTALGLVVLAPAIAVFLSVIRRGTGLSPAVVVWVAVVAYLIFAALSGFTMGRVSFALYGDSSFTGRQVIWDFVNFEIARKPLLGWGYQSFWLVGPTGPAILDAPGWVKTMPNGHNGFYDTILELGYVGFVFLLVFLTTTLQGFGRVLDRDKLRGWVMLSVAFYVIIHNGLESAWMRGFEFLWIVFLILVAEIARSDQIWQSVSAGRRGYSTSPASARSAAYRV